MYFDGFLDDVRVYSRALTETDIAALVNDAPTDLVTTEINEGEMSLNGTATIDRSGNWSYTPTANWNRTDSFIVSVTDDDGDIETQTTSTTVTPIGYPTTTDDSFSVNEDSTLNDTVSTNGSTTLGGGTELRPGK